METFKKYLVQFETFRSISIDDLNKLPANQKVDFSSTEVEDKLIYSRKVINSIFSELEISFDNKTNKSELTYHTQLDSEGKKNDIVNFLKELYSESGKEFVEIKSSDKFIKNNTFVWAYTLENNKFSLGV